MRLCDRRRLHQITVSQRVTKHRKPREINLLGVFAFQGVRRRKTLTSFRRERHASGIHGKPSRARIAIEKDSLFESVTRGWCAKFNSSWVPTHDERIIRRLEHDLSTGTGTRPVSEIAGPSSQANRCRDYFLKRSTSLSSCDCAGSRDCVRFLWV